MLYPKEPLSKQGGVECTWWGCLGPEETAWLLFHGASGTSVPGAQLTAMLMRGPACLVSLVGWESCQHQQYSWQGKGEVVTGMWGWTSILWNTANFSKIVFGKKILWEMLAWKFQRLLLICVIAGSPVHKECTVGSRVVTTSFKKISQLWFLWVLLYCMLKKKYNYWSIRIHGSKAFSHDDIKIEKLIACIPASHICK